MADYVSDDEYVLQPPPPPQEYDWELSDSGDEGPTFEPPTIPVEDEARVVAARKAAAKAELEAMEAVNAAEAAAAAAEAADGAAAQAAQQRPTTNQSTVERHQTRHTRVTRTDSDTRRRCSDMCFREINLP